MDGEQYYAAVKRLGLKPTGTPGVYINGAGEVQNIPNPDEYTSAQRAEIIDKLKERMGISPTEDGR